jgi:hypothetical protein
LDCSLLGYGLCSHASSYQCFTGTYSLNLLLPWRWRHHNTQIKNFTRVKTPNCMHKICFVHDRSQVQISYLLIYVFMVFLSPTRQIAVSRLKMVHDRFFPYPSELINHKLSYHSKLHNLGCTKMLHTTKVNQKQLYMHVSHLRENKISILYLLQI